MTLSAERETEIMAWANSARPDNELPSVAENIALDLLQAYTDLKALAAQAEAERDAAREALRAAREYVSGAPGTTASVTLHRIDAALGTAG